MTGIFAFAEGTKQGVQARQITQEKCFKSENLVLTNFFRKSIQY
jgi:hypothetical protein